MRAHRHEFRLCAMYRVLKVKRSGYYAWLESPMSDRHEENRRRVGLIKHHWLASGGLCGHRKVTQNLCGILAIDAVGIACIA
jgi:putative transposase